MIKVTTFLKQPLLGYCCFDFVPSTANLVFELKPLLLLPFKLSESEKSELNFSFEAHPNLVFEELLTFMVF